MSDILTLMVLGLEAHEVQKRERLLRVSKNKHKGHIKKFTTQVDMLVDAMEKHGVTWTMLKSFVDREVDFLRMCHGLSALKYSS